MPVSHRRAPRVARDATVYTNVPNRRGEARSSHLCTLLRSQGHSQPKPAAQQCTQTPQSGAERLLPPICVHYCSHGVSRSPTVYTNALIWRGEPRSSHSCTLLRSHGVARDTIVYTNAPIRRLEALTTHLCTLLRSLAPQESRQVSWSNMSSSPRTWLSSRRRARW